MRKNVISTDIVLNQGIGLTACKRVKKTHKGGKPYRRGALSCELEPASFTGDHAASEGQTVEVLLKYIS